MKKTDDLFALTQANSIDLSKDGLEPVKSAAKDYSMVVVMGHQEVDGSVSGSTLFNSVAIIDADGRLLNNHRKLMPTNPERMVWGFGDGSTLRVVETAVGRVGALICWENYMPLARMTMYGQGVEIYLSPTADARETWQATLRHIACEGRCFVLGCNQFVRRDMYPDDMQALEELQHQPEVMCRGGSAIISPLGEVLAGPLYDQEGILYVDLDLAEVVQSKLDFDVVGHYARPDVFQLTVNERPAPPVQFTGNSE